MILSEHRPESSIEVHKSIRDFGDTQVDLIDRIRSYGYEITVIDHRYNISDWQPLPDELPDSDTYMINAKQFYRKSAINTYFMDYSLRYVLSPAALRATHSATNKCWRHLNGWD